MGDHKPFLLVLVFLAVALASAFALVGPRVSAQETAQANNGKIFFKNPTATNENLFWPTVSTGLPTPTPTPNGTHSISGRLFFSGLGSQPPVAGANVMLGGSASGTATTDSSGFYSFNNLPDGGTYTITVPKQVGFRFLPAGGYTFANLSSDQTANFERLPIYSVSGRVTDTNGSGVPNAELTLQFSGCNGPNPFVSLKAITDANGNYDFGDLGPADIKLSYAISFALDPQKAGYSFAPDFVPQAFTPFRNQPATVVINFTATYQGEHWKATGSLNAARAGHTATLLNNGKVLVVGGSSDPTSAELYEPGPGAWSTTGSLNIGRTAATATLLPNGKVLVVSGNTAEIYDPASGTWSLTGNLKASHTQPTATLLANGKVLVAGGATATSELYDPTPGGWTITGSLNSVRSGHTATLLTNGDVLVVSGTSAELYNPASGTWKLTGTLTTPRSGHSATLLPNGKVLVAGGDANGFPHETNSAELYDPSSGTWRSTSSLNSVRSHHAAVLLPNGTVLVTGGDGVVHQCDGVLASAEIYDPASETWISAGLMSYERSHHTATFLATGMVLLTGGTDTKGQLVGAGELFTSYGISGRVTAEGNGLRDVTVTLSGDANAVTWTDANGNYSFSNLNLNGSYTVTAVKGGFNFLPPSQTISSLNTNLTFDFIATATVAATSVIQFSSPSYTVSEGAPAVSIAIVRVGDTSGNSSVNFATNDVGLANCAGNNGVASQRCDYISTAGAIQFSAGEAVKFVSVPIVDDSYRDVNETFTVGLTNPSGAVLGNPANATITIVDNEATSSNGPNPIVGPNFFVRQHYLDFLNRQPDPDGFAFWINEITSCGSDTSCVEVKRINVSASFFLSIEFQQTGYLVERMYQAAFGSASGSSTLNGAHTLPVPMVRFNEFLPDTQRIGRGVVVGQGNWQQQLENNKNAFAGEFVQRSRFMTAFPTTLLPARFVDALFANAGVTPTATDMNAAIAEFNGAGNTTDLAARGRALRDVAENSTLNSQEFNRAFVLMEYFGYLRRNPNDAPDSDYSGYEFWLSKLNAFGGDYQKAELVKAFIASTEYRTRFGP